MSTILFDEIKTMSKITDTVLVGFSGGKDSIVTLDLCVKYFKNVIPFFLYIAPDLSFQERQLKWYENKYNLEISRAMIKHSGSIDKKRGRFYPVAYWSKSEVLNYIKFKKLRLGEDSRHQGFSFKSLEGRELYMLNKFYPNDYKKVLELYPLAEASRRRFEEYERNQ